MVRSQDSCVVRNRNHTHFVMPKQGIVVETRRYKNESQTASENRSKTGKHQAVFSLSALSSLSGFSSLLSLHVCSILRCMHKLVHWLSFFIIPVCVQPLALILRDPLAQLSTAVSSTAQVTSCRGIGLTQFCSDSSVTLGRHGHLEKDIAFWDHE